MLNLLKKSKKEVRFMKSRSVYNHETAKRDQKFRKMIRNTPKLTAAQLLEESNKLWGESIKRAKEAREHRRMLRQQAEEVAAKEEIGEMM